MVRIENGFVYLGNKNICIILKADEYGKTELVHLGGEMDFASAEALSVRQELGYGDGVLYREKDTGSCLDRLPLFYGEAGRGDYRETAIELEKDSRAVTADFQFESAALITEAPDFTLPGPRGAFEGVVVTEKAKLFGLTLKHYLFLCETALSVKTVLINGEEKLGLRKLASLSFDIPGHYNFMSFGGGWIREAHREECRVGQSRVINQSSVGFSSSVRNPGVVLSAENASEDFGEVYGINLIYSGNHYTSAERSPQGFNRIVTGIDPARFTKVLKPFEEFETPAAVIAFSDAGRNGMSRNMHRFVNEHIVPAEFQYKERPILYNSWEGCMFDFNERKIMDLAKKAIDLGCELFVLDDGWFGKRDNDLAGLGDYAVNTKKLPSGIAGLAEKIRKLGLDFGLWFEPEAVNPDSDLYRAHPDWAIHEEGLEDLYGRNELLLDLRREEVRDYIVENVGRIIDEAKLSYVKWDMNRQSALMGADAHDYILGLYDVLSRIFKPRPEVLLESCSSGGNRFDLGMLSFGPQVWSSDDTDPIERLDIQSGLSYLYPQSTMGAHVSAAPHAQTLRKTPLSTRFNVSAFGVLGYELDLNYLSAVDEEEIRGQISFYKEHRKLLQFGTFRRIEDSEERVLWQVGGDGEGMIGLFHRLIHAAPGYEYLKAFLGEGVYRIESKPQFLRVGDFGGLLKHITPVTLNPKGIVVGIADSRYRMSDTVFSAKASASGLRRGLPLPLLFTGTGYSEKMRMQSDFGSNIFFVEIEKE